MLQHSDEAVTRTAPSSSQDFGPNAPQSPRPSETPIELDVEDTVPLKGLAPKRPDVVFNWTIPDALKRRRQLMSGALIGATVLLMLIVYLITSHASTSSGGGSNNSDMPSDELAAMWETFPKNMQDMMDPTTHPCEDFYQFSCGKWLQQNTIPADEGSISASFSTIRDRNELELRRIAEDDGLPFLNEMYSACMDTTTIDRVGNIPVQHAIQQIQDATDRHVLFQLAGKLARTTSNFMTQLSVQADAKDATTYALYASQAGLSLPDPDYYLDVSQWNRLSPAFRTFITTLFKLTGSDIGTATANTQIVIDAEIALAKKFVAKEALMDPEATYNPMSLQEVLTRYPTSIGDFLTGANITTTMASNANAKSPQNNVIVVETPTYFQALESWILSQSLAKLKVLMTYQYINSVASRLSEPFLAAVFEFYGKQLNGQQQRSPRWKTCLRRLKSYFPHLMGKYFSMPHLDTASEQLASDMVKELVQAMQSTLDDISWLDVATRNAANLKLSKIATLVGHSTEREHFPFVLSLDSDWTNHETILLYQFNKAVARIATRVDRTEWFMSGATVNAYYDPSTNQVVFPAGILQPPLFSRTQHVAANFGGIGAIMAHEITHSLDDQGRHFDGDGNLVDWWTDATTTAFKSKTQCLVTQYDTFSVQSAVQSTESTSLGHVNGNFTLGENIADGGGVGLALRALQQHVAKNPDAVDSKMDSTAMERMFFTSYAQAFCAKTSDEALVRRIASDPHSPEPWRVNGVVMNSQSFASVFGCSSGSTMNPEKKCRVW